MQNYNLPAANRGNTSTGVSFILPTSELYSLTGATARIHFRRHYSDDLVLELSSASEPPTLAITLPYTIEVPPAVVTLEPGTYKWDLQISFSDGRIKTYIGGEWLVNPVITITD